LHIVKYNHHETPFCFDHPCCRCLSNKRAGDDIRCAGGNLHIMKNIAGDLVVTGGKLLIEENVTN
jgi:hypothetical protein